MSRLFSTVSGRSRRELRRVPRTQLNDLFALFPELPRFQRPPIADQIRHVRENVERMQRDVHENIARHRAAAARVKASWLAKHRG